METKNKKKDKTNKYTNTLGLLKVPAEALPKEAQVEIGGLKSLVDEKEYEIDQLKKRIAELEGDIISHSERQSLYKEALKKTRESEVYKSQRADIEALRKRVKEDRKDRDALICTISGLRKKLEAYEGGRD